MLRRLNIPELGSPVGPYSHATVFNDLVFVSGLTATGSSAANADAGVQLREIFRQLEQVLAAANSDIHRLLKVTLYVRSFSQLESLRGTLHDLYGGELPASAAVAVADLFDPQAQVEMEAIAACRPASS